MKWMARKEWMKQLRELVSQDDKIVYEFALQAVQTQPQVSPKLLNRALETAISFPHLTRSFLVYGNANAVNKDTLPLLLELESLLNFRQQMHLTRFFEHLSPKLICEHEELLEGRLEDDFIQFNKTILTSGDDELEQIYYDLIQALNNDTKFNATYMTSARRVQDRLLKLGLYTKNDVKDTLKSCKSMDDYENYEAIFAIRAASMLEEEDYVESLAILLTSDMDVLIEEVMHYYIAIGSKKAVKAVKPYIFVEESFGFAVKTLQGIAGDKAVEVLVDAYKHVSEDDKAVILEALCFMLAEEVLPLLKDYEELGHDPVFLDMTYYYYNAYHYHKVEHEALTTWRDQFEEQEDAAAIERENARQELILRLKPGRNEKCICGSGKKFKKCCGAAVNNTRYAFS